MRTTRPTCRITKRRVIWSAFAVITLLILWQVYDILTGKPQPTIDYATQFYELCSSAQPEGENAWPDFVEVLRRAETAKTLLEQDPAAKQTLTDGSTSLGGFHDLLYMPLDSPKVQPHIAALDELWANGTFKLMARVAKAPRCVRPRIIGTPFHEAYRQEQWPQMSQLRQLARIEAARMRVGAYDGNWRELLAATDEALAADRIRELEPTLMNHLVVHACIDLTLGELRTLLYEYTLDESTARALLAIVDRRTDLPSAEFTLSGERLMRLDYLQNQYTPSGRLPLSSYGQFSVDPMAIVTGTKQQKTFDQTLGDVLSIVLPGRARAIKLDADYLDTMTRFAAVDAPAPSDDRDAAWLASLPLHQVVIKATALAPERTGSTWRGLRFQIDSTRLLLAIEIYIAHHGRAPASLTDLVPDILASSPHDALTGTPFGYRGPDLLGPADEYTLWSYGSDGENNNGHEGTRSRWQDDEPGTDILINLPRDVPDGIMP